MATPRAAETDWNVSVLPSSGLISNGVSPVRFQMRWRITSQYPADSSHPHATRSSSTAAAIVVPLPMNGSNTTSPSSENASRKNSTSARGNGAECDPCDDSDFTSITFDGRATPANRPSASAAPGVPAASPRAPVPSNPEPDFDFGLFGE